MTPPLGPLPPVVKILSVQASPQQAFTRFTAEIGTWWPLASHSVGEAEAETVTMEGCVGGRIVERIRGGRESVWGTINVWDPPRRVAFSWHPGEDASRATAVEVRFAADGDRTRVELTHSGFERLAPIGKRMRKAYSLGWIYVFGLYAKRRGPLMLFLRGLTSVLVAIRRVKSARGSKALNES